MLGDKFREKTPTPNPPPLRTRRSITPIKSPSPSPIQPLDEDCEGAHSHKRCSCFRRPKPPPIPESNPWPIDGRLKKRVSSANMSSSLPSTPDKSRNGVRKAHTFDDSFSTTPAGPPPSSQASSTPAGPPPSYLGSSMIPQPVFSSSRTEGSGKSLQFGTPVGQSPQLPKMRSGYPAFTKQVHGIFSSPSAKRYNQQKKEPDRRRSALSRNTPALQPNDYFQPPPQGDEDEMDEGDETYSLRDGEDDQRSDIDQDESMEGSMADFRESMMAGEGLMVEGEYDERDEFAELAKIEAEGKRVEDDDDSDLLLPTPGRARGKTNESLKFGDTMKDTEKDLEYQNIARDIYKNTPMAEIKETDDLILQTEKLVMKVYDEGLRKDDSEEALNRAINVASGELVELWDGYQYKNAPCATDEYDLGIGPDPMHSPFANANFLAGLLLQLHLPPLPNSSSLTLHRMSFRASTQSQAAPKDRPVPATLLEWIEKHHNPMPGVLTELHRHEPAPSASRTFWKDIQSGLLRGKVGDVAQILRDAGWEYARDNGNESLRGSNGFHGQALTNIEKAVTELVNLLEEYCPAIRGDWNTQSSDWKMFRLRADTAFDKLKEFAEGRDRDNEFDSQSSYNVSSFAHQSRRAESKVPWHVYQNLKVLYEIISGSYKAIVESSGDWCEATIALVAWWDEAKEDHRVVLGRSHFGGDDGDPGNYLRKLKRSAKRAIRSESGFQVNALNPVEIGLICVFRGDVEAAIGMIRTWSLPLAAAVAEIAALDGWLPRTEPLSLITMQTFEEEDLDLLGLTGPSDRNDGVKDHTLNVYASALARHHPHQPLKSENTNAAIVRDSWELAIAVLGRLDDPMSSEKSVGRLLGTIKIDSTETLNKILVLLNNLGLANHAETQAEKYANDIVKSKAVDEGTLVVEGTTEADETQQYGKALWYYARAHKPEKVKEILNLLISFCLVESRSFPTSNDLDPHLARLILDKKAALEELENEDFEASQLIQRYLSGYAVLRQYYDARDEQVLATDQKKVGKWQGIRNKAALQRLITLINSAADNIRGGLYDESCDAVVPVEFLLVLLGEVLPFISLGGPESIITIQHIEVLLRAIEDLQTVTSRVHKTCNEFFMTVLAAESGLKGSNPGDLLLESTESGWGRSQYSHRASTMAASQLRRSMGSSGVLVDNGDVKRGWDWRKGLSETTTADEVLSVLRLGLAQELARCWIGEADGNF